MSLREQMADSAMEYAKDRADFLSRPDYYAHARGAAKECETAIIRLANTLEHYMQKEPQQ